MRDCINIRPLPHFNAHVDSSERAAARDLRLEFRNKIGRRLSGHYSRGFCAGEIVETVRKHKTEYPYFVKIDISKFYPSIRHKDIVVNAQIAYRDLLSLDFVPIRFKQRYVGAINSWCKSLPLRRGIPLGSPMSAILPAVLLVPLWLEYKRQFGLPFIIYVDDMLFFAKTELQCTDIYTFIENRLKDDYDLDINLQKTCSGRFSKTAVEFCGWRFSGGYAVIAGTKTDAFKQKFTHELCRSLRSDLRTLIKRMNRKIDGYANYYKHGDVGRQFDELDKFIRSHLRIVLRSYGIAGNVTTARLESLGIHSLVTARNALLSQKRAKRKPLRQPTPPRSIEVAAERATNARLCETMEKVSIKLNELLTVQRKILRAIEVLT